MIQPQSIEKILDENELPERNFNATVEKRGKVLGILVIRHLVRMRRGNRMDHDNSFLYASGTLEVFDTIIKQKRSIRWLPIRPLG
jgi:hypothetical protein